MRLKSAVLVQLLSCLLSDQFSLHLIFRVESRHAVAFVLNASFGIGFTDDLTSDIDLRLESALGFLGVLTLELFPFLTLSLDECLLALVEIYFFLLPIS